MFTVNYDLTGVHCQCSCSVTVDPITAGILHWKLMMTYAKPGLEKFCLIFDLFNIDAINECIILFKPTSNGYIHRLTYHLLSDEHLTTQLS